MSQARPKRQPLSDVQLSKKLSWLLRHGALKEGLPLRADGYVPVKAIIHHPRYEPHYTLAVLERLAANDKKQRYTLRRNSADGEYEIRANQGHSLAAVQSEDCLQRIERSTDVPLAVHGTYYRNWACIRVQGLMRMSRNHVHFAANDKPELGGSGFRSDCEVLIYLNVRKVLEQGMQLYRSSNNVILCAGIDGCIPTENFCKVIDRRTGAELDI